MKLVRESLVLLKNKNNILPFNKSSKLLIIGPASDNIGAQCGGQTNSWQGFLDIDLFSLYEKYGLELPEGVENEIIRTVDGTTILKGFQEIASKKNGEIYTDINDADKAEAVVLVIGEKPYAEGLGDDNILDLYNGMALSENKIALENALKTKLPIVTILVSGRPRIVTKEIKEWNAFIAAWLPGTQGDGIAQTLYGDYQFKGKLSFTWPKSVEDIPINYNEYKNTKALFKFGFGLKYSKFNIKCNKD